MYYNLILTTGGCNKKKSDMMGTRNGEIMKGELVPLSEQEDQAYQRRLQDEGAHFRRMLPEEVTLTFLLLFNYPANC